MQAHATHPRGGEQFLVMIPCWCHQIPFLIYSL